jgi:hypothetical protein
MGRQVFGVDAPTEMADAFAAAWSQRAGTTVRAHKNCRVYRLAGASQETPPTGTATPGTATPGTATPGTATPARLTPPQGMRAVSGSGPWPLAETAATPGPPGRLRCARAEDRALLADWLAAFAAEAAERLTSASDLAADLISYGGAVFWEVPQRPSRLRDAAHYLPIPHLRDPAQLGEPGQPMALVTLTRPVAGTVRISIVYTPPERRHSGYATALTLAVSRAVLAGTGPGNGARGHANGMLGAASGRVNEVVMITDKNRSDRWGGRLGYQLVGERAVLRFGPVTGPMPRAHSTGAMPRLPTGPLPRLPRLRR